MIRRTFLSTAALTGLVSSPSISLAASTGGKTETRLLGTWRSDADRTVKHWRYSRQITDENREKFEKIFGKLVWRITPTRIYSEFDGDKFSERYSVIGSDRNSVVVKYHHNDNPSLQQFFFEEKEWHYVVSGYNFEFFKRVEPV